MKRIIPHISVSSCKHALEYYKDVFHGEVKNVQMADGNKMFEGHEGKITHAELIINEYCILYFNDFFGEEKKAGQINLLLDLESEEEINALYAAMSNGSHIQFELQKTFWGAYHAVLTDRYGVTWSLNYGGNQ